MQYSIKYYAKEMKMDIEKMMEEFITLPDVILDVEKKIIFLELSYEKLVENIKDFKYQIIRKISIVRDDKGKIKYTNEVARTAELNKQLHEDKLYIQLRLDTETLELQLKDNKRLLNYYTNKRVVFDTILKIIGQNYSATLQKRNDNELCAKKEQSVELQTQQYDYTEIHSSLPVLDESELRQLLNDVSNELLKYDTSQI